jgi:hypothetical protein
MWPIRGDARDELLAVYLSVVDKGVRVAVGGDDARALPDRVADLRPRVPLPMEERDSPVTQRVR